MSVYLVDIYKIWEFPLSLFHGIFVFLSIPWLYTKHHNLLRCIQWKRVWSQSTAAQRWWQTWHMMCQRAKCTWRLCFPCSWMYRSFSSFFLVAACWYAEAITGTEIRRGWGWGWNYSNERSIEISPSHWSVYLKNYYSNYILWAWLIFLFLKKVLQFTHLF